VNVLLDTNVSISAILSSRGKCADVLRHCAAKHVLITSEPLLNELSEKLLSKFKGLEGVADRTIASFRREWQNVKPLPLPVPVCRDPDDDVVLGTAVAGQCDVIVTGDRDLLVLESYEGIRIVSPAEFWSSENPA
jgi:putative PIN family toxin of toxin-antitoxin system